MHVPQPPLRIDHFKDLIGFRHSDMGAAFMHSLHHSRCPPLLTLERKHLLVNTRLLLLIAAFRPGCSAFRRPAQVQQCARLMSICGQQPQESSKCMLASVHASTYFQHAFCTGTLSCLLSQWLLELVLQLVRVASSFLTFDACIVACRDGLWHQHQQ